MASHFEFMHEHMVEHPPPEWLPGSIQYEALVGSRAFGISNEDSDMDICGFCTPPKEEVFPTLDGEIPGFSSPRKRFGVFQNHHVLSPEGKEYDFSIYSIVRFFRLCADSNPNAIDALFVPDKYILYSTPIGQIVRNNRKLFLSKMCWTSFEEYAYQQLRKMTMKKPIGKRKEIVDKYGYDVTYAYHVVRLLDEVEQILTIEDIDLQRSRGVLESIRSGEWKKEDLMSYVQTKSDQLNQICSNSPLRDKPDHEAIRDLLMFCLERQYGDLSSVVVRQ